MKGVFRKVVAYSANLEIFFACALFSSAALEATPADEYARLLQTGSVEAQRADYAAARADVEAAVRLDPNNSAGWYRLGLLLGQLADFRGAEGAFRRAIQFTPGLAEAHYNLGLTLVAHPESKLDWPGAILEMRKALKSRPAYPEALNLLGAGLSATGDDVAAVPEFVHAIRLNPAFAEAHFNLAISFQHLDRLDDAVGEYTLAVKAKGDYPEASTALGRLLLRMGKPAEAEREIVRALQLNPDLSDAHYAWARVLQARGKPREAAIEFDIASQLARRKPDAVQAAALSNQGLEAAANGDMTKAINLLRQAVRLKPDYGVPHYNLGLLLADSGNLGRAAEELIKATSLLPGMFKPWYDLGRVLSSQGDFENARAALSTAQRLSPGDASIRAALAEAVKSANEGGDKQAAPARDSVIFAPSTDTAAAHAAFAFQLSGRDDSLGAAGEFLRVLALEPAREDTRRALAAIYERLGDTASCMAEYRKVIDASPSDGAAHLGLGKILLATGEKQAAEKELTLALRLRPHDAETQAAWNRAFGSKR